MSDKESSKKGTRQEKSGVSKPRLNKWFDASSWIDADNLKRDCSTLETLFVALKAMLLGKNVDSSGNTSGFSSFDQMARQLNLDESTIEQHQRWSLITSWVYLLMAGLTLIYVVHLWVSGGWLLGLLSISFVLFLAAMACRERMKYYQLKNRLLSCTLNSWWREFCHGKG